MNRDFWTDFARACAGALLFSFPLLMTMEMWWFGFYISHWRLALFLVLALPLLLGLAHFVGFRTTHSWFEEGIDALVAYAAGFLISAIFLGLFAILLPQMPLQEIVAKIAILAVPAAIGAIVAQKQLGQSVDTQSNQQQAGYLGECFLMIAGAVFVAFNVAPTEEMVLIAYKMTPWHALALLIVTLIIMHALVYSVGFAGQESSPKGDFWYAFALFTVVGYVIALLVSLYLLWTFGRLHALGTQVNIMTIIVLAFPAGLGAAVARLVV